MNYICYYRVSTKRQGQSGYGLKAQSEAIFKFIRPDDHVIREFTEIESATGSKDRPELTKAVKLCRETGATLITARLDRLYRNVYMMSKLMESKIEIVFCDFPDASKFTLHILAAIAEYESTRISTNTKLALKQVKKTGSKSGRPSGKPTGFTNVDRRMGPIAHYKKYLDYPQNKMAFAFVRQITSTQHMTSKQLAAALNVNSYTTHLDREWEAGDVIKLRRVFTSIGIAEKVQEFERYKIDCEVRRMAKMATQ